MWIIVLLTGPAFFEYIPEFLKDSGVIFRIKSSVTELDTFLQKELKKASVTKQPPPWKTSTTARVPAKPIATAVTRSAVLLQDIEILNRIGGGNFGE